MGKEIIVKARPHSSRKVVFTELVAGVLSWGESVGLSGLQMANLLDGFRESAQPIKHPSKTNDGGQNGASE